MPWGDPPARLPVLRWRRSDAPTTARGGQTARTRRRSAQRTDGGTDHPVSATCAAQVVRVSRRTAGRHPDRRPSDAAASRAEHAGPDQPDGEQATEADVEDCVEERGDRRNSGADAPEAVQGC